LACKYLDAIDQRSQQIVSLTARIEVVIEPFRCFCDLIDTIPGIGERCAEVIVAETGADMSIFPTAAHLASWAGTCPGSNDRGSSEVDDDSAWQSPPEGPTRRRRLIHREHPRHLPRHKVPAHRRPPRT
jgi:transposase